MATTPSSTIPNNPLYGAPSFEPVQVLSDDGAITIPQGVVILTKAGASAITLADPPASTTGTCFLTIYSTTAQAHTLTLVSGLRGAGAGADVGTFGGAIADQVTLFSYNGYWYDMYNKNVTFA